MKKSTLIEPLIVEIDGPDVDINLDDLFVEFNKTLKKGESKYDSGEIVILYQVFLMMSFNK